MQLGGKVSKAQLQKIEQLLKPEPAGISRDIEDIEDGHAYFCECTSDDFEPLVEFCKSNHIALSLQWDAKAESDGNVQFWVDGKYRSFAASQTGDIHIPLSDLRAAVGRGESLLEFLQALDVPRLPEFCAVHYWLEGPDGSRHGPYDSRKDAAVDAESTDDIIVETKCG